MNPNTRVVAVTGICCVGLLVGGLMAATGTVIDPPAAAVRHRVPKLTAVTDADLFAQRLSRQQIALGNLTLEISRLARAVAASQSQGEAALSQATEALALAQAASASSAEPADMDTSAFPWDDDQVPPAADQQAADQIAAGAAALGDRLAVEREDRQLAARTSDALERAFDTDLLSGSSLFSAECGQSLCRAVIEHTTDEDRLQFDLAMGSAVPSEFRSFASVVEQRDDGTSSTTVFLGREPVDLHVPAHWYLCVEVPVPLRASYC